MRSEDMGLYLFAVIAVAAMFVESYPLISLFILIAGLFLGICIELFVWLREMLLTWYPKRKKKRE